MLASLSIVHFVHPLIYLHNVANCAVPSSVARVKERIRYIKIYSGVFCFVGVFGQTLSFVAGGIAQ